MDKHLVSMTIGSRGVEFNIKEMFWQLKHLYQYFSTLVFDKTLYGQYWLVVGDGLHDWNYNKYRQYGVPMLTVCRRKGQENVFLLPALEFFLTPLVARLSRLRKADCDFRSKCNKVIWYGQYSGSPDPEANTRCRFVRGSPAILDKLSIEHDIKFTHLSGGSRQRSLAELGRYEPGRIPAERQIENKFLVSLDGHTYPSNFGWSLAVNSLIFRNRSSWQYFYDEFFFPEVDYLSFDPDLSDFEKQVRFAQENRSVIEEMVENSTQKMCAFTEEFFTNYTLNVFRSIREVGSA